MALQKDAVLSLRLQGFDQAVQRFDDLERRLARLQRHAAQGLNLGRARGGIDAGGGGGGGTGGRRGGGSLIDEEIGGVSRITIALAGLNAIRTADFIEAARASNELAASLGTTQAAFQNMIAEMQAAGQVSGDWRDVIAEVRSATQGQISDMDIMRAMLRLVASGAQVSTEQFGKFADNLLVLAAITGRSVDEALSRVGRSVSTLNQELVDELLLTPRLNEAVERYAEETGKAADELTEQERRTAFLQEIMRQAEEKAATFGDAQTALARSINQTNAALENQRNALVQLSPSLTSFGRVGTRTGASIFETIVGFGAEGVVGRALRGGRGLISFATIRGLIGGAGRLLATGLGFGLLGGLGAGFLGAIATAIFPSIGRLFSSETTPGGAIPPTPAGSPLPVSGVAATAGQTNFVVQVNVPLQDGAIERTASEVARSASVAMRRRINDVDASLRSSFNRELDNSFPVFVG